MSMRAQPARFRPPPRSRPPAPRRPADLSWGRGPGAFSPATPVEAARAEVRLPVAQVNDGNLHRFSFTDENTTVRFVVISRPDGRLATALDACQTCGPQGY